MFVLQHAMEVIGLDEQTREDVRSLVAGILHLGNIAFVENGNYAAIADDGCKYLLCTHSLNVVFFLDPFMKYYEAWICNSFSYLPLIENGSQFVISHHKQCFKGGGI